MEKQKTIIINGQLYDALSGMPVNKNVEKKDGDAKQFAKKKVAKIDANSIHQSIQKSQLLNRNYIKKVTITEPKTPQTQAQKYALDQFMRRRELAARKNEEARARILAAHRKGVIMPIESSVNPFVAKKSAPKAKAAEDQLVPNPILQRVNNEVRKSKSEKRLMSAEELKDKAIKEAFERAAKNNIKHIEPREYTKKHKSGPNKFFGIFAASCAAVLLFGYLTYLSLPNLSVRIAASQAGIEVKYPGFKPYGYSLKGLVSYDNGQVRMSFSNGESDFTISQQKSSWDSYAVLNNYVTPNWGDDYSITKERGLTIYSDKGRAAWVNGGVLYTVDGSASLSSEQIHELANSL